MSSEFEVEVRTIMETIEPGATIVDVGSNVGTFTRLFLEQGHTVISVEPQRREMLRQASELAPFCNAGRLYLENVACSSHEGTASLYVATQSVLSTLEPRWHEKVKPGSFSGQTVEVQTVPLAMLIRKYATMGKQPQAVKVDAEGHDYPVLIGLFGDLELELFPRIVMFEFQTTPLERQAFDDCVRLLVDNGYRDLKFTVRHGPRLMYESPWADRVDDINAWDSPHGDIPKGYRYGNLLARHFRA